MNESRCFGWEGADELMSLLAFFAALSVPLILWFLICVAGLTGFSTFSAWAMSALSTVVPIVAQDMPFLGDLTPAALAGLCVGLAPNLRQRPCVFIAAIACLVLGYLSAIHTQWFLQEDIGERIVEFAGIEQATAPLKFFDKVRIFCLTTAAALLGIKVNSNVVGRDAVAR